MRGLPWYPMDNTSTGLSREACIPVRIPDRFAAPMNECRSKMRPRLCVAFSYDVGAQIGVLVAELRGDPHRYWERVVNGTAAAMDPARQLEFAFSTAREAAISDFDLFLPHRAKEMNAGIPPEFGAVRIRWIARRKNQGAQRRAHARLRQLVPLPPRATESYSLADLGVDLEIAAYEND
jgi:hypothetical protein